MAFNTFMHERNIYKDRPDFGKIASDYPEFQKYALPEKKGTFRIDFNDPNALRMLTRILLKKDFDLDVEIPDGYLIPTVPQRLNYILWIEDLLTVLPKEKKTISGIDIGTGPCAILSLLGSKKNRWKFVSTDSSEEAIKFAKNNIETNNLEQDIKVAKVNKGSVLQGVMDENEEKFDFCVCNPPFFENKDDIRKKTPRMKEKLAFFAKKEEIFSEGGEVSFVKQLLKDSIMFKDRISLYSSMFGKKKSCIEILKELQNIEGVAYTKTEFCQGNTIRWGIAWTFLKDVDFEKVERPKPKKSKKAKPPLTHSINRKVIYGNFLSLYEILKSIKSILRELQIPMKVIKSVGNYAEIEISSNQNTWSHQRRKRREHLKGSTSAVDIKTDVKDEAFQCVSPSKSDLSNISTEKIFPGFMSIVSHSTIPCTDMELGEAIENESKSCLPLQIKEEKESRQQIKVEDDLTNTISLEEKNKNEASDSFESFQDSVSQKRKRDTDDSDLNINSNMQQGQDTGSILEQSLDTDTSPVAKRLKISEGQTLPIKQEIKVECDSSPRKNKCLFAPSHEIKKTVKQESVQINQPEKNSDTLPLLYAIIKLRTTKEDILLEMNCPAECNRETMHQVFQLLKNKIIQS